MAARLQKLRAQPARVCLLAIMLIAYALRVGLVMGGGQFYFPDEYRYQTVAYTADSLYHGNFKRLPERLFIYQPHPGMPVMTLPIAYIHRLAFALEHGQHENWTLYWTRRSENCRFSSLFFALPSTLSIGLAYLLARRTGAGTAESLLAAFLLAASNSMFLYSRHLVPYDIGLLLGLLSLWLALDTKSQTLKRALAVGLLAFLCFWVYHGSIYLYVLVVALYGIALAGNWQVALRRLACMALVALLIVGAVTLYTEQAWQIDSLAVMAHFAGTVNQGDFDGGFIFPLLYFRDAEGGMALLWLLGLAATLWRLKRSSPVERRRGMLWLGCLLFLYFLLALLSDVFHAFVVYGRTARQLTPFIALLCAYGLTPWLGSRRWRATLAFITLASALALTQFLPAIRWTWYMEFYGIALRQYDSISCETAFAPPARAHNTNCPPSDEDTRYRIINAGYIHPITEPTDRPPGTVLAQFPHPLMLPGLRYESYTAEMRAIVERESVMVQLIDTNT